MDLKEVKKLVLFAKKAGVKSLTLDGFIVEFDGGSVPSPFFKRTRSAHKDQNEKVIPPPDQGPTLDQINEFIYGTSEESA